MIIVILFNTIAIHHLGTHSFFFFLRTTNFVNAIKKPCFHLIFNGNERKIFFFHFSSETNYCFFQDIQNQNILTVFKKKQNISFLSKDEWVVPTQRCNHL